MRRPPSVSTVRWVVFGTIALTLFHFTDNAVNVDTYPAAGWQPDWFEVVVAVAWFAYTAVGVAGYRLYERGRFGAAHACLLIYGYLVISSLGHFFYGSPDELTTRGLISVFVDVAAGSVVIAVALSSILARSRERKVPIRRAA
jgi:small-conductance mechanosensitive channel